MMDMKMAIRQIIFFSVLLFSLCAAQSEGTDNVLEYMTNSNLIDDIVKSGDIAGAFSMTRKWQNKYDQFDYYQLIQKPYLALLAATNYSVIWTEIKLENKYLDKSSICNLYYNLATLAVQQNEFTQALKMCSAALKLSRGKLSFNDEVITDKIKELKSWLENRSSWQIASLNLTGTITIITNVIIQHQYNDIMSYYSSRSTTGRYETDDVSPISKRNIYKTIVEHFNSCGKITSEVVVAPSVVYIVFNNCGDSTLALVLSKVGDFWEWRGLAKNYKK